MTCTQTSVTQSATPRRSLPSQRPLRHVVTAMPPAQRALVAAHALVKERTDNEENKTLNEGIARFYDESSGLWEDM